MPADVVTPPDYRWVVAACWEGRVEMLVTGDQDLLGPPPELPFRVLSPRGFWELLAQTA